jgi:hypothetical protein
MAVRSDESRKNERKERVITVLLGLILFFIVFYLTFTLL